MPTLSGRIEFWLPHISYQAIVVWYPQKGNLTLSTYLCSIWHRSGNSYSITYFVKFLYFGIKHWELIMTVAIINVYMLTPKFIKKRMRIKNILGSKIFGNTNIQVLSYVKLYKYSNWVHFLKWVNKSEKDKRD